MPNMHTDPVGPLVILSTEDYQKAEKIVIRANRIILEGAKLKETLVVLREPNQIIVKVGWPVEDSEDFPSEEILGMIKKAFEEKGWQESEVSLAPDIYPNRDDVTCRFVEILLSQRF